MGGFGPPKWPPRACQSLGKGSFFSTYVVFMAFFDFLLIFTRFGKVLEGFREGLGRVLGGFGNFVRGFLYYFVQLLSFSWRDLNFSSIWEGWEKSRHENE